MSPESDPERLEAWLQKLSKGNPLVDEDAFTKALRDCSNDEERQLLRDFWEASRKAEGCDELDEPKVARQERKTENDR